MICYLTSSRKRPETPEPNKHINTTCLPEISYKISSISNRKSHGETKASVSKYIPSYTIESILSSRIGTQKNENFDDIHANLSNVSPFELPSTPTEARFEAKFSESKLN